LSAHQHFAIRANRVNLKNAFGEIETYGNNILLHRTAPLTWLNGHIIAQLRECRGRPQHQVR
jgi:hypothetical protein